MSHYGKCPKIEANYDDYREKTIRPLNATIFYYFFRASSSANRTWAQMMLSAARFPNDRMRRAYMRVFAWSYIKKSFPVYFKNKYTLSFD